MIRDPMIKWWIRLRCTQYWC